MSTINLKDILDPESLMCHIENLPMAVIIFNKNLEIIYWSKKATQIFEWDESEAIHKHSDLLNLIYEKDYIKVSQTIAEIMNGQKPSNQLTNRNYTKSRKVIYCDWYNSSLMDEQGNVTSVLCFVHDATKKQELKQKLARERAAVNKKVTAAALKSQELERGKISRELHDNVNQVLTTVKLYTELCQTESVAAQSLLPKCTLLLNQAIGEIRDISKRLAVPSLQEVNISEILQDLVISIKETQQIDVRLDLPNISCRLIDDELQLAIYRITQEALTNILKHAYAKQVSVTLACTDKELILEIHDDGNGFDTRKKVNGIGITNMTSRARLLNGTLKIDSVIGKGSTLSVSFPVTLTEDVCRVSGGC